MTEAGLIWSDPGSSARSAESSAWMSQVSTEEVQGCLAGRQTISMGTMGPKQSCCQGDICSAGMSGGSGGQSGFDTSESGRTFPVVLAVLDCGLHSYQIFFLPLLSVLVAHFSAKINIT